MQTNLKNLQDVNALQDLRTYTGTIRKSGKPDLPTTAILNLYMRRNERDRLVKELAKLKKRRGQLRGKLKEVEKEMTKLLAKATQTAMKLRGGPIRGSSGETKKKARMVLGY